MYNFFNFFNFLILSLSSEIIALPPSIDIITFWCHICLLFISDSDFSIQK
jgi:hypothetical protein